MKKIILSLMSASLLAVSAHAADVNDPAQNPIPAAPTPATATATATTATPAAAPETPAESAISKLSVSGSFAYESTYVFRGVKQTDGAIQGGVELGYPVEKGNLYAGIWTSQPVAKANQTDEIDLYVGWTRPLTEELSLDIGYVYYWYADAQSAGSSLLRSNELHLGFTYDTSKILNGINLSPSLYYYYDWNLQASTLEFSLSYSYDLSSLVGFEGLSLDPAAYLGWNDTAKPAAEWGPTAWNSGVYYGANLNLTYQVNDFVSTFIGVRWAGKTITSDDTTNPQYIWGGAGVNFGL